MANKEGLIDVLDGTEYRSMNKRTRIAEADKKLKELYSQINNYDLEPLKKIAGLEGELIFEDYAASSKDFQGKDFGIVSNAKTISVQDKRRVSKFGSDLGIEFIRFYKRQYKEESVLVFDGGRDVYQIPYEAVRAKKINNGWLVERDWKSTQMICDYHLLHAVNKSDLIWLKSSSVKKMVNALVLKWLSFPPDSTLFETINNSLMRGYTKSITANSFFESSFDIKCLKEPLDKKKVILEENGEEEASMASIGKAICYLPYSLFREGKDYVVCSLK